MENHIKKNNNTFINSTSFLNKNNSGLNYEEYIYQKNKHNTKNINTIKNDAENKFIPRLNMNSLYMNMMLYNNFNMQRNKYNFFTTISQRTHSLLLELEKDNKETEENNEILNDKKNINNNNKNSIYSNNFEPLIKKLESQEDERFKKSRFLQFIKDINSNKLIIDEENNIIKQNPKYKEDDKEENKDGNSENNINEFEELLDQIKTYMNYSREDLAKNLLEQIFNNSKIKLKENQKYLEKAYLFLILCYYNENEDLLSISIMIDLLYIISDENDEKNKYEFLYEEKYLSKEFIEKINQRNFDITNKEEYNNYINNKQKIQEEIENYIKHKIVSNNNENYNQLLLLLYGLILISNEKYNDAQNIFNQLTILDETNYFYYNILGVVCVNQKNFESAIKFYKKALKINSKYPKCLINLSVLLLNKGQYKESCKFLISALKIYDDIPDAWNYLLSNVIELNEEDLIYDINNKNLENVEKTLFDNK
jgi:hypothetical protein